MIVEHVISLSLEPIQRLLSALVALGRIVGAPLGNLWLLDDRIGGRASDLASEAVHEHLGGTAVHGMNPMPSTDTAAVGARRHILGNLEVGIDRPNALMVNAENGQILGLDAVHVRSIRNRKGATLHVVNAGSVELRERVTWAGVFSLANISGSLGRSPPLGGSLVAGQLRDSGTTGGEFEELAGFRLVLQVSVEPPLFKSILLKRGHRPIIVGEILHGDIEPPHRRVIETNVGPGEGN